MSSGAVEPRETSNGAANLVLQSARALSSSSAQNGASKPVDLHLGAKRCVFIYKVLVGYEVQVEVVGGKEYEGIFCSITSDELVLQMAKLIKDKSGPIRAVKPEPKKTFKDGEWIRINAVDVRLGAADVGTVRAQDDAGGFGTDAAISRGRGATEGRMLERWAPDAVEEAQFMRLEEATGKEHLGWDQFSLNEKQFGVKTDYAEELYTTALDPSKSTITVAEASRIAAEIERGVKSGTTNIHILEERGIEIDDGDVDEEARYGAVIREDVTSTGEGKRALGGAGGPGRPAGAWGRGPPSTSAPISIDPRRETNKVRAHMTGGKASSPYGTPKLDSPLVSDAQNLAALNLNPGVPRVDEATRRDFEAFKAEQQAKGVKGSSLSELKQFSQEVGSRLQTTKGSSPETATVAAAAAPPAAAPALPGGEEGTEEGKKTSFTASSPLSSSSSLNPNAKSFSFNINAKSFNPTSFTPAGGPGPSKQPSHHIESGPAARHNANYQRDGSDRRDRGRVPSNRPPPPPPDGSQPPPPPPGRSHPGGGVPGHMQMTGMMPMVGPVMMMPGGSQPQFFMVPSHPRPGGPMFIPSGNTASYMAGSPMMMSMIGPSGSMSMPMAHGMPAAYISQGSGYAGGSPGGVPPRVGNTGIGSSEEQQGIE